MPVRGSTTPTPSTADPAYDGQLRRERPGVGAELGAKAQALRARVSDLEHEPAVRLAGLEFDDEHFPRSPHEPEVTARTGAEGTRPKNTGNARARQPHPGARN